MYVDSAYNQSGVIGSVFGILGYKVDKYIDSHALPEGMQNNFKMYVISPPRHGRVVRSQNDIISGAYSFQADEGYIGPDAFVIRVDTKTRGGANFNLKYKLAVVNGIANEELPSACVGMKFNITPSLPIFISWNLTLPTSFEDFSF